MCQIRDDPILFFPSSSSFYTSDPLWSTRICVCDQILFGLFYFRGSLCIVSQAQTVGCGSLNVWGKQSKNNCYLQVESFPFSLYQSVMYARLKGYETCIWVKHYLWLEECLLLSLQLPPNKRGHVLQPNGKSIIRHCCLTAKSLWGLHALLSHFILVLFLVPDLGIHCF